LLHQLDNGDTRLEWALAPLHAATVLLPEEAFGLNWQDLDWALGQINISRGWLKSKETKGKNEGSMTQVAMHPALAEILQGWRRETVYHRDSDWVFSSAKSKGKAPGFRRLCWPRLSSASCCFNRRYSGRLRRPFWLA
jgi:integrase